MLMMTTEVPLDNDDEEIDAPQAAALLGMTLDAFRAEARRDKLPASKYAATGARLWYKRGDVRVKQAKARARAAKNARRRAQHDHD